MGKPIDLNLLRDGDPRSRRRSLTRLGEGLREDGRVELVGLDVKADLVVADSEPADHVRESLKSSAVAVLVLLEDYFGLHQGTLSGLVSDDESMLFSGHRGELPGVLSTSHVVALRSPLSPPAGSGQGEEVALGSRHWELESGLLLRRLTNDVVCVPSAGSGQSPTLPCLGYLARPRASAQITVLPDFVWPDRPPRYDPVRAGDLW